MAYKYKCQDCDSKALNVSEEALWAFHDSQTVNSLKEMQHKQEENKVDLEDQVFNQKLYIFGFPKDGNKDSNLTVRDLVNKMTEPADKDRSAIEEEDVMQPRFPICFECLSGEKSNSKGII
jgi:hypothetical protein